MKIIIEIWLANQKVWPPLVYCINEGTMGNRPLLALGVDGAHVPYMLIFSE